MTTVPATVTVVHGGFATVETGVFDPDTNLFAYQGWADNQPVAVVVTPIRVHTQEN